MTGANVGEADAVITSTGNARVKDLVQLRKRRVREESGTTVVEGAEELELALAAGVRPVEVYICAELMAPTGPAADVIAESRTLGARIVALSRAAFEKAAYRQGPDGVLALVATREHRCDALPIVHNPLLLVCQAVEKPGNLGAMLRTADAAGVSGVIAADPVTDWGNPNVVRASKGTVFSLPVASDTTEATLEYVATSGIPLVAATPHGGVPHTDIDYAAGVAIAVGAEKDGLTQAMLERATYRVAIPMSGRVNSLNVATSAAIVLYEAVRQRRSVGH